MSHVSCFMSHFSCFMSHVSCFMTHVSYFMSHVTYFLWHVAFSYISCDMLHILCHMCHVLWIMLHILCQCHIFHVTYSVFLLPHFYPRFLPNRQTFRLDSIDTHHVHSMEHFFLKTKYLDMGSENMNPMIQLFLLEKKTEQIEKLFKADIFLTTLKDSEIKFDILLDLVHRLFDFLHLIFSKFVVLIEAHRPRLLRLNCHVDT